MHILSRKIALFASLFPLNFCLGQDQITTIVEEDYDQWYYLHPIDGKDPAESGSDSDFQETWFHQNLGSYFGGSYNGPLFSSNAMAPFAYGTVDGIVPRTPLEIPPLENRFSSYFLLVIDGGSNGYRSLQIELLADDGAFVYLNGNLIARDNISGSDTYKSLSSSVASETSFETLSLIDEPVLNPGPNLLAVSVHNTSPSSSDLGFAIRVKGIDMAIPPPVTLIEESDSNWAYLNYLDENNNGLDPESTDADFNSTWNDQSIGDYIGSKVYDGPLFKTNITSPFSYGGIDGIESGSELIAPNEGTRRTVYFLREVDGGSTGYSDLNLTLLAHDGAFVYLNGNLIAKENLSESSPDTWSLLARGPNGETDFSLTSFTGSTTPIIKPGPNLLAVSVHQSTTVSSDLGLKIKLTGIAGLPDIGAVYTSNTTYNSTEITWTTGRAGDSSVRYGLSPENLDQLVNLPGFRNSHSVSIDGLIPNTTYYFEASTTNDESFTTSEGGSFKTEFDPNTIILIRGPYLQSVAHDRITLKWRTSNPGDSTVHFGPSVETLDQIVTIPGSRTEHEVQLNNLSAYTTYYYKVESKNEGGVRGESLANSSHFFRTSPTSGTPTNTRIWVIGDSGTANNNSKAVYNSFRTYNEKDHTDVWLMLGDNAYDDGTDQEYQEAVFDIYPELLANTPLWPTFGNHDFHASLGEPYFNIFSLPIGGECGGVASGTEAYYSFNYGNIHFVCLDSQSASNYSDVIGGTGMADWLRADLEACTEDWIIAYFHHGPYTKGSHDSDKESKHIEMRNNMLPILEDYGVDLVLSGHSHAYERSHLINGHYGLSDSYEESVHAIDAGNGSSLGSIDSTGTFVLSGGDGVYQKPLAEGNVGQVSTIVGSSGKLSSWDNGSTDLVNPDPHPVFIANLRLLGSMVIDIENDSMRGVFIDTNGTVRDDFTIVKGSSVTSIVTDNSLSEGISNSTATVKIVRSGAIKFPLVVDYTIEGSASIGDYDPPLSGSIQFAPGEKTKSLSISAINDTLSEGPESIVLTIAERTKQLTETSANRHAYRLTNSTPAELHLEDLPSQSWWFSHFGAMSLSSTLWKLDHDNDGNNALLEYGLNGDPTVNDSSVIAPAMNSEKDRIELEYITDTSKTDIQYQVLTSTDLSNWTTTGVVDVVESPSQGVDLEVHKASIPIQGSSQFLQLRIFFP